MALPQPHPLVTHLPPNQGSPLPRPVPGEQGGAGTKVGSIPKPWADRQAPACPRGCPCLLRAQERGGGGPSQPLPHPAPLLQRPQSRSRFYKVSKSNLSFSPYLPRGLAAPAPTPGRRGTVRVPRGNQASARTPGSWIPRRSLNSQGMTQSFKGKPLSSRPLPNLPSALQLSEARGRKAQSGEKALQAPNWLEEVRGPTLSHRWPQLQIL